jgi:hypothetical protein
VELAIFIVTLHTMQVRRSISGLLSSFALFTSLQPDLDCLSRQPFCSKAFVVCMEFWLGLAVRYRLPRRKRVESPSLELVRNLLLGRPLRLDHLLFPFSPRSTSRRMASGRETTSSCFSRQSSIADSSVSCQRMPICVPLPVVGGRPRFFFGVPLIDLFINTGYHKSRPRGRSQLPPRP